jgi:phosphoglycolate phosphatase
MSGIVLADVDGTLVDSNYQHVVCWFRAFAEHGVTVPMWRVHRAIGMGGDQLVAAVAGDEVEARHGDGIRAAWSARFDPILEEVTAFEGARELLVEIKDLGFSLVLASSGKPEHVDHYLRLLDAEKIADAWTTAEDVEQTKPAPDLLKVALGKVSKGDHEGAQVITFGDSVWDCQAAMKLGVPSVALLSGGFGADELAGAGARRVYDDLAALRADLSHLLFALVPGSG